MDERFVLLSYLTNLRDTPHMLYLVDSSTDTISLSVCIIYLVIQTHRDTFGGGQVGFRGSRQKNVPNCGNSPLVLSFERPYLGSWSRKQRVHNFVFLIFL